MNKLLMANERFADVETVKARRSVFSIPFNHKFTMNAGSVVPFYSAEVLPGDSFDVSTTALCRMMTPIFPVMDNAFLEFAFFFVPMRLTWDHTKEFFGENRNSAWTQNTEYTIPHAVVHPSVGGVFDSIGVPVDTQSNNGAGFDVSVLQARAYRLIWNRWFRNENLQDPVLVNTGDDGSVDTDLDKLLPVGKLNDFFTTCLPSPQKGNAVDLDLTDGTDLQVYAGQVHDHNQSNIAMRHPTSETLDTKPIGSASHLMFEKRSQLPGSSFSNGEMRVLDDDGTTVSGASRAVWLTNLWADTDGIGSVTVNQLRTAFQVQRILERSARGGTRYIEYVRAAFGVSSPDARLQDPEYLGGSRSVINMQQVLQTSATDSVTPQGNTSGLSKTFTGGKSFNRFFTEHGFIIGTCYIRTMHTYQQGLPRQFSRRSRYDFYDPALSNVGEQPVYRSEIYANGTQENDTKVFGYREAWDEYRSMPSRVSGYLRSGISGSLDPWHYGDYYASAPVLSAEWWQETPDNIDRTIAVSSSVSHQFVMDVLLNQKVARCMPVHSTPGLIDHF